MCRDSRSSRVRSVRASSSPMPSLIRRRRLRLLRLWMISVLIILNLPAHVLQSNRGRTAKRFASLD
ncbi:hypothetical protein EMPG_13704 [Blastomyces silverae]|uniref:Uncharacterized protein n=1 Tax=Blastomyces silverae TaxID=2060906 RepID=A0A0H1BPA3_9EURO|nr:hypothetical protein EMPG_13704 [Blastomyces silverae]